MGLSISTKKKKKQSITGTKISPNSQQRSSSSRCTVSKGRCDKLSSIPARSQENAPLQHICLSLITQDSGRCKALHLLHQPTCRRSLADGSSYRAVALRTMDCMTLTLGIVTRAGTRTLIYKIPHLDATPLRRMAGQESLSKVGWKNVISSLRDKKRMNGREQRGECRKT